MMTTLVCALQASRSGQALAGGGESPFPSPSACVRACPDGANSAARLWQGISPQVKEWELGKRAEALKWFEDHQFGRTPAGRLPDQRLGERSVEFPAAGLKIDITCMLPEGADARHPVPVFLFGDHRGGDTAPEYRQESYAGVPANSIAARGYAYVRWNFNDVCPNSSRGSSDRLARWPLGIISYLATGDRTNANVVRTANGWGTIGAWAWGNSRVMDWIESRPELDSKRVAVLGHGRGGKTALWTGAQDERFAMVISNGSGCGGARLGRAQDPKAESFEKILHNFPNWFCPALAEWIGRDSEVPHDADDLIRLIAPRLVYVASGSEDAWAGPAAEKAAWESAHDLYRAYRLEDRMGYHCHDGIHKLRPDDWEKFMDFADERLKKPSAADSDAIERRIAAACADGSRMVTLSDNPASPDRAWHLVRAIRVPGDFSLVFDGCRVELVDGVQDNLVRNAGIRGEGDVIPERNIRILGRNGAVLSGGKRNHYLPKRSGDPNGWRSVGILLCDVSDYEVGGFAMEETQCWAISQERCHHGRVHDITFGSTDIMFNQDGVDVRKGCHDLMIENISGSTGDDVVALTAYRDPKGAPPRYGMQVGGNADLGERDDVYNVTIRNVRARSSGGHGIIRLLTCDGIRMHHVSVENVFDTASGDQKRPQATIRIGDVLFHKTRRCEMGEMHHISVRDVTASGNVAVWVKGPLRDSEIVSVKAAPGGKKYDITAPVDNVRLD
jgi:dienelactone hydrolase